MIQIIIIIEPKMNQLENIKINQALTAGKKKMDEITRENIKNTSQQQEASMKDEHKNERRNLRGKVGQQKMKLVKEKPILQMAKKRDKLTKQMKEQIQRDLQS